MPQRWLDCLDGHGEIDLSDTAILSQHQLMWSTKSLSSKLTSFFSSKALSSKIKPLDKKHYPETFQKPEFKGHLYQLNEPVLDIPSLIKSLSKKWQHRIIQAKDYSFTVDANKSVSEINIENKLTIKTQEVILTSGEGNESLLKELSIDIQKMQRRPLQMVLAKSALLPQLYAHCIGASSKRHSHSDGDTVWYIGGNIAEEGTDKNTHELIEHTKTTLKSVLPFINTSDKMGNSSCEPSRTTTKRTISPRYCFYQID